jgi:hypothetical protein
MKQDTQHARPVPPSRPRETQAARAGDRGQCQPGLVLEEETYGIQKHGTPCAVRAAVRSSSDGRGGSRAIATRQSGPASPVGMRSLTQRRASYISIGTAAHEHMRKQENDRPQSFALSKRLALCLTCLGCPLLPTRLSGWLNGIGKQTC